MRTLTNYDKVREMNHAFGLPTDTIIGQDPALLKKVRTLIQEEYKELMDEFDIAEEDLRSRKKVSHETEVRMLKELIDLLVVSYGAAAAFGWEADWAFQAVHASNMSKLGDDGKPIFREDGKFLKGPNYKPANMEAFV